MDTEDPAKAFRDALTQKNYDRAAHILSTHPGVRTNASPHTRTPWILDRVWASDAEGVRFLAYEGFDPNAADPIGQLPLMLAAQLGLRDVVRALLDAGADPHGSAAPYPSMLSAAVHGGDPESVELLVQAGARMEGGAFHSLLSSPPGDTAKFAAVLDVLSRHGYNLNINTKQGFSALDEAALMGDEARVRLLLERGADPNSGRRTHNNPLCTAIFSTNANVVEMLLDAGATPRIFFRDFEHMWDMLAETPGMRAAVMAVLRRHGVLGALSEAHFRHQARRRQRAHRILQRHHLPDGRNAFALRTLGISRKHPSSPVCARRVSARARRAWQYVYGLPIDHDIRVAPKPIPEERVISLGERESWDRCCG